MTKGAENVSIRKRPSSTSKKNSLTSLGSPPYPSKMSKLEQKQIFFNDLHNKVLFQFYMWTGPDINFKDKLNHKYNIKFEFSHNSINLPWELPPGSILSSKTPVALVEQGSGQ